MPVSTGAQTKKPCHPCDLRLDDIRCSQSRSAVGSRERNKRTSCSTRVPRPLIDLTRDHGLKLSPSDPSCWIYSSSSSLSPGGAHHSCHYLLLGYCFSLFSWEMHTVAQGRRRALTRTRTRHSQGSWPLSCNMFLGGPRPSKWFRHQLTSGTGDVWRTGFRLEWLRPASLRPQSVLWLRLTRHFVLEPLRRRCRQETLCGNALKWRLACCNKRCAVGLSKKLDLYLYTALLLCCHLCPSIYRMCTQTK